VEAIIAWEKLSKASDRPLLIGWLEAQTMLRS